MGRTSRGRNRKQKEKASYSKLREDLQLRGQLPTTPEGAVRDERVDPLSQDSQQFPQLDINAIRNGWAVPEPEKARMVDRLVAIVLEEPRQEVLVVNGKEVAVTRQPDKNLQVKAFNALQQADQRQYERDNPEDAGRARGGVNVAVDNSTKVGILGRLLEEARGAGTGGGPDHPQQLPPASGGDEGNVGGGG